MSCGKRSQLEFFRESSRELVTEDILHDPSYEDWQGIGGANDLGWLGSVSEGFLRAICHRDQP